MLISGRSGSNISSTLSSDSCLLAGAKRILAQPTVKKEPVSVEILDKLVD